MIVEIKKLFEGKGEDFFAYSKLAEDAALKLVSDVLGCSYEVDETPGYNPNWDGKLGHLHIEVKYSTANRKDKSIYIETHRESGGPSALLLSKSDFYLTITPGYSEGIGEVGKVRLFSTSDLRAISYNFKIEPNQNSRGFYMPNKYEKIKDIWVGDVYFNTFDRSYDMSKLIKVNKYVKGEIERRKIKL